MKLFNKNEQSKTKAPGAGASEPVQQTHNHGVGRYIIESPLLTEKAARLETSQNKYVFVVHPEANKPEIRKEVERLFDVSVTDVRIINQPRKRRVWRGHAGYSAGAKKAIVTVGAGKKIEILPT